MDEHLFPSVLDAAASHPPSSSTQLDALAPEKAAAHAALRECSRESECGSAVILTGPPGAGKTTVARLLAEQATLGVHLEADGFWDCIRHGWIPPWQPASYAQNATVIRAVAAAAAAYASGGYFVVVDGILGPWFLDTFRSAWPASTPLHYVVLRPQADVALRRALDRGVAPSADAAVIRQMYEAFRDLGAYERHALDNSAQPAAATAAWVRQRVLEQAFTLSAKP